MLCIDKIFVDTGYMHKAIETALRRTPNPAVKPSHGIGVTAKKTPLNQWPKRAGRRYGDYWFEDKPLNRGFRTVTLDVNYWKCAVHDALNMEVGDSGGLTLWGKNPERHRMFADHCNAETVQWVSAMYQCHEWASKPDQDNHLFDCMQ